MQAVARKTAAKSRGIEHLVHEMMHLRRCERSTEYRTVGCPNIERSRHNQQTLLEVALKRPPQLIGTMQQRDIRRMLEVSQTDDPGDTMG